MLPIKLLERDQTRPLFMYSTFLYHIVTDVSSIAG